MKKLLSIFSFFICLISSSQVRVAPNEYATFNIKSDGTLWASGGRTNLWSTNGNGRQALPTLVRQASGAAMPLFTKVYAGFVDALAIDVSGNVWHLGDAGSCAAGDGTINPAPTDNNMNYAQKILVDSAGNSFTGITKAAQIFLDPATAHTKKGWLVIKSDSTLWVWGRDDDAGFRGTGVFPGPIPRPVKITMPGNRKVIDIAAGYLVAAVCSDGTVWTWGSGGCGPNSEYFAYLGYHCADGATEFMYPHQVPGITGAKNVAGGRAITYVLCGNDSLWAFGGAAMMGIGTTNNSPGGPTYITPYMPAGHGGVKKIAACITATHAIMGDSTLWGWGNSAQGEVGNGSMLDRNRNPFPDGWSNTSGIDLWITSPVQLVPTRHDFINIYTANGYTYWFFDEAANGQLYFCGRNKGAIANNGIINADTSSGQMAGQFDQSWNEATSIPVNLFTLRDQVLIPAAPCLVAGNNYVSCIGYTPPANLPPTVSAGSNQSITTFSTTLTATATPASGRKIATYVWSQISGPNTAYFSTFNDSAVTISRLTYGSYIFRITVTDKLNSKATSDMTVTVSAGGGAYAGGIQVGAGEYTCHFIANDGTLTAIGNRGFTGVGGVGNGAGSSGIPEPVISATNTPVPKVKYVAGHFHGSAFVDVNGRVWTTGASAGGEAGLGHSQPIGVSYSPFAQMITYDTSMNQFDSVVSITGVAQSAGDYVDQNGWIALKSTGTIWIWGTVGAMQGNGTNNPTQILTRPIRIPMPGGRLVSQIVGGYNIVIALCTDGTVWTWGNNYYANLGHGQIVGMDYASPYQIMSDVAQIAGGNGFNYAVKTNGDLYGWGLLGVFMGLSDGAEANTPQLLSLIQSYFGSNTIIKIITNSAITTVLLSDGTIMTWGDNTEGSVGNGITYFGNFFGDDSPGYAYDYRRWIKQVVPVNIAPTRTFKNIFSGNFLTYYTYAIGTDDSVYAWGKNRASNIANRVEQPNSGVLNGLEDSWNVTWVTPVHPFSIPLNSAHIVSTCPACLITPNIPPCSYYPIPVNTKPTAITTGNQSIVGSVAVLDGTLSTDNVYITYYLWTQTSGPNNAIIDLRASPTPIVSSMITGTYTFKLRVTDNGWLSDSTTMTVTVNSGANVPPTANAGTSYSISLPQTQTYLYGSGTAAGTGNYITTYAWTQISGTAAHIVSPSTAVTNITGLISTGTRVFRLTVTDNNGLTDTSDITITVNPNCN